MRPLFLHYEDDAHTYTLKYQYLFGRDLLVAPVYEEGRSDWTLYLPLFDTTPRVFYVSEFGWVASLIFLRILQATLAGADERGFRCRRA